MLTVEARYCPRGACKKLFELREREVVLSGPAGTGKSRACLEKLNACAEKYAGMRGLILRRNREHLTESALVTYERDVLPDYHPARAGGNRAGRKLYEYPNGSVITVAGIYSHGADQAQRIMSAEYDLIFVQEAIELSLDEWEKLGTRLRSGVMPYQQLIADCNPSTPSHWLYQRAQAGQTLLLPTRHEDNPMLYDGSDWTAQGRQYLALLDQLTGARRERLRHGRWVQAEGTVYDFDERVHVVDTLPSEIDHYYLSIDFGFRNPTVAQVWAEVEGRVLLIREWYQVGWLTEDMARTVAQWLREQSIVPRFVVCDHDAEDRATFEKHSGLRTRAANKQVKRGIEAVQARLRVAEDGQAGLQIYRSATVQIDDALKQQGLPTSTLEEFGSYVWDTRGVATRELPVKQYDHGMDAMRYLVAELDCKTSVERWVY